jgi:hypothetical protein
LWQRTIDLFLSSAFHSKKDYSTNSEDSPRADFSHPCLPGFPFSRDSTRRLC